MAITAADIKWKFSVAAAAGNTTAGTPAGSLGDQISTTEITDATLHNLFDVVTGDENAASDVEYRCIFIHNAHASLTWENVVVWLSAETGGGAEAAIAVDGVAASAIGSGSPQADVVANESTAPSGETFSSPVTKGTGLSVGNLAAGECRAIWIRRTAADTGAVDTDGVVIRAEGDTAA